MDKNPKIVASGKATHAKHKEQQCQAFELKVDTSKFLKTRLTC